MAKQTASDIRTTITDTIVESLEAGGLPAWRKPWANDPNGLGLATSLSTGRAYSGINQLVLQCLSMKRGYQSRWFSTFQQIKHAGGSVKKGEKAVQIVLWKPIKRERMNEKGEEVEDKFLVMRTFSVFNVEQTTGLDQFRVGFVEPKENTFESYEQADRLFDAIGADIRYGGNRAYYSPGDDYIQMPHRHQFESSEAYYETLAHEAIHWSERRIGFDRKQETNAYALGELVAELGACFLMGELGLPTTENLDSHAVYVGHWLKGMRGDTRFIFRAAATASKAVDFLLSHVRQPEEQPVSETVGTP
ncbi:MAG: zincin-like metallopeptidase domain-containing protein [Zavarzinella sp.]